MSGSLFDDNDISAVPAADYVPHHYTLILEVLRLPPGDPGERAAIADWLSSHAPSATMIASLQDSEYADLL